MCDNEGCSRPGDIDVWYGFEVGPRVKSSLCEPCKDMLIEGSNAVDIEVVGG